MKIVLMSGISGAGKNTYISDHFDQFAKVRWGGDAPPANKPAAVVFSADDFFESASGYKFNPSGLSAAHGQCLRNFLTEVLRQYTPLSKLETERFNPIIVVNNTNLTTEELAPYVAIGTAYGAEIELVTLTVSPHIAAARSLHIANPVVIKGMHDRLMARKLPPFWAVKQVVIGD